jgi:hypothetical protein
MSQKPSEEIEISPHNEPFYREGLAAAESSGLRKYMNDCGVDIEFRRKVYQWVGITRKEPENQETRGMLNIFSDSQPDPGKMKGYIDKSLTETL